MNTPQDQPLDKLCAQLYALAESQRETNNLLTHLMQKPVTQNSLSCLPNITYLKETHSILISSHAKQLKKLWCSTCKKKSLVNVNPQQHTAKSQCGHLRYCQECTIEIHQKIIRCHHCVPFLHPKSNTLEKGTEPIQFQIDREACPVCSSKLALNFQNTSREQNLFDRLFKDYYVVVDVHDPVQCVHSNRRQQDVMPTVGIKRERDWVDIKEENQPKRFAITEKINEGLLPKVRDGVLGMSKMAIEVGSNFLSRLSELDEEEEDPFFDGLL